jgi:RNA polymerase sigma factor (sigma-70 family)
VQDIVIEIMTHLDRFKPGTDFQKWVSAIIRNMRADCFTNNVYSAREVPVSQFGRWTDDGDFVEFEATAIDAQDTEDVFPDEHDAHLHSTLDALRTGVCDGTDRQVFDLLRIGMNLAQVAMRLGISHDAARQRFSRLKKKLGKAVTPASLAEIETIEAKAA